MYYENFDVLDVFDCIRPIVYDSQHAIRYTTSICDNEVYVSLLDVFDIMKDCFGRKIGYIKDDRDLIQMMKESNVLSKSSAVYDDDYMISYLEKKPVMIDMAIKICNHYRLNDLRTFLEDARKQINEIGIYVGDILSNKFNRHRNNNPNLCQYLTVDDLEEIDLYPYDRYQSIADQICDIVFNTSLNGIRSDKGLWNDSDKLSDVITDEEFEDICIASIIYRYLLFNSDVSDEGIAIFAQNAIECLKTKKERKNRKSIGYKNNSSVSEKYKEITEKNTSVEDDFNNYM